MSEHCVCCGDIIPEGRQVCPRCEAEVDEAVHSAGGIYNARLAQIAQMLYVKRKQVPHFAPYSGECFYCSSNIYGRNGYSVRDAATRLITGCPFCRHSFCE